MKAEPKITIAEWLDELARLSNRSDEGMTSGEWAAELDISRPMAVRRLKEAQRAGWLRTGKRTGVTLDGRKCVTPVYQITKPKKGK